MATAHFLTLFTILSQLIDPAPARMCSLGWQSIKCPPAFNRSCKYALDYGIYKWSQPDMKPAGCSDRVSNRTAPCDFESAKDQEYNKYSCYCEEDECNRAATKQEVVTAMNIIAGLNGNEPLECKIADRLVDSCPSSKYVCLFHVIYQKGKDKPPTAIKPGGCIAKTVGDKNLPCALAPGATFPEYLCTCDKNECNDEDSDAKDSVVPGAIGNLTRMHAREMSTAPSATSTTASTSTSSRVPEAITPAALPGSGFEGLVIGGSIALVLVSAAVSITIVKWEAIRFTISRFWRE